ncbi:hypothetical protein BB558_004365, partial [Smittium angustum]
MKFCLGACFFIPKTRVLALVALVFFLSIISLNKIYSEKSKQTQRNIDSTFYNLVHEPAPLCKTPERMRYDTLLEK